MKAKIKHKTFGYVKIDDETILMQSKNPSNNSYFIRTDSYDIREVTKELLEPETFQLIEL
jgi:hypothetical protein